LSEWVEAIATINTSKAKQILLSSVDPEIEPFKGQQDFEHHVRERLAEYIAGIIREDPKVRGRVYALCKTEHSAIVRSLLAGVVSRTGTSEALVTGLDLIHDQLNPSIPYELFRGLESAFLGKQPDGVGYGYSIEPITANEIRYRLFEMTLKDESRKYSAWQLLGQIEAWRIEYGRPDNEPRHPALDSGKPWPAMMKSISPTSIARC